MTENEATREMTFDEEYEILQREKEQLFSNEEIDCEPPFANCVVRRALRCIRKLLEESQQYRAIGTVEDLKSMKENGAFSGVELAQIACMQIKLKEYHEIGTIEEFKALKEITVTQMDIDTFKAYIDDCMDDVAFGNTDWNHSLALALKCMELHKT